MMRVFAVLLPSGIRYWTVLDDDLAPVPEADAFLRYLRLGRDGSELTTRSYAGAIALFLRWCQSRNVHWHTGAGQLGLFIIWLRHAKASNSGMVAGSSTGTSVVLAGPGHRPVRGPRRINVVLTAVRGFISYAVTDGSAPGRLLPLVYEVADTRDLPEQARGEDAGMVWRLRARHRVHEPVTAVDRATDAEMVGLLGGCRSARDRLIILLMGRAGLRRGELCGLRRSDMHMLSDSTVLKCPVPRAHLHVQRRDNVNGAWAKSLRARIVPLDSLVVQACDAYVFERLSVPAAADSDFLLVNLFRAPIGAPMPPDAINTLVAAAGRRAGLARPITPHQLRHAFGSNLADADTALDEIAELLGHRAVSSSQIYVHPDPGRLRQAIERVPGLRNAEAGEDQ